MKKVILIAAIIMLFGALCSAACINTEHVKSRGTSRSYTCKIAGTSSNLFDAKKDRNPCKNCGCPSAEHNNIEG
jgi:type 1 fimbria pilin